MSVVSIGRETSPEGFRAGNGTVGTSPAQLDVGCPVLKHVVLRADSGNTNTIKFNYTSASATNGFILNAGDTSPPIYVDDVNKVWVIGGASGQVYSWIAS